MDPLAVLLDLKGKNWPFWYVLREGWDSQLNNLIKLLASPYRIALYCMQPYLNKNRPLLYQSSLHLQLLLSWITKDRHCKRYVFKYDSKTEILPSYEPLPFFRIKQYATLNHQALHFMWRVTGIIITDENVMVKVMEKVRVSGILHKWQNFIIFKKIWMIRVESETIIFSFPLIVASNEASFICILQLASIWVWIVLVSVHYWIAIWPCLHNLFLK